MAQSTDYFDRPGRAFFVLAGIVFVSGFCSLAYQVVWLREFRLVFGGAAPAASAVLAVFMGGLGLGGLVLGKRVEAAAHPGRWYAGIEAGITLAVLLSPVLLWLVRRLYIATGGVQTLGLEVATILQVVMTALVIGPACFLMGGTLPAVLRVAQTDADKRRATTAVFYGVNVAGAVAGAVFATFVLLQRVGNLRTLLLACAANAVIAGLAFVLLRGRKRETDPAAAAVVPEEEPAASAAAAAPAAAKKKKKKAAAAKAPVKSPALPGLPGWFAPAVAFASGFVFFVIELVWYRASIPLFGGSVYNFGLILAVALAGIGSGSLVYALALRRYTPTLGLFAMISGLLAICIILPFAMGDRLAHAALLFNTFFLQRSFSGLVFGWTLICIILVFLPAFFAGIQFPLLISLLGSGGREIAAQVGRTYAWNTLGAVSGALLGGFVLMPVLSITGTWRLAALVAVSITGAALILQVRGRRRDPAGRMAGRVAVGLGVATVMISFGAAGPSAYWLHHPIGYGRANALFGASEADWVNYVNQVNRSLIDSKDGRETSAAVTSIFDYSMLSNGKSDSSAIGDSSTTVMSGLLGAILHPAEVKTACVVGFGTGITAGWMTRVETIEQLDVIELEQAIVDLGSHFRLANFDVTASPKAAILTGDAREILITRPQKYDLIVSEPSNLHRAGVANLYTLEFYHAVSARLEAGGLFCQWVQTYETDMESVQMVIATLAAVFPKVELWQAGPGDLLLVCSMENKPWDLAKVRKRLNEEPFTSGVRNLWGTTTAEGFFSRAVANADFTRWIAGNTPLRNSDDLNHLEFRFAQNLGMSFEPVMKRLMEEADARGELRPAFVPGSIPFDADQWAAEFVWKGAFFDEANFLPRAEDPGSGWPQGVTDQLTFLNRLRGLSPEAQAEGWPVPAMTETSRLMRLSALANTADPRFAEEVEALREGWPIEYHIYLAEHAMARGAAKESLREYYLAIEKARTHPLIRDRFNRVIWQGIESLIKQVEFNTVEELVGYFRATDAPLAYAGLSDGQRRVMMSLAMPLPLEYQVRAAEAWGSHPQWDEQVLGFRRDVFKKAGHPDQHRAGRDWDRWSKTVRRRAAEEPGGGQN